MLNVKWYFIVNSLTLWNSKFIGKKDLETLHVVFFCLNNLIISYSPHILFIYSVLAAQDQLQSFLSVFFMQVQIGRILCCWWISCKWSCFLKSLQQG